VGEYLKLAIDNGRLIYVPGTREDWQRACLSYAKQELISAYHRYEKLRDTTTHSAKEEGA